MNFKSKYKGKTPSSLGLTGSKILLPPGGLKEQTVYIVEVAFNCSNVIHRALFYTGFLNGNDAHNAPGGYNEFLGYEDDLKYHHAYYLEFIHDINMSPTKDAMRTNNVIAALQTVVLACENHNEGDTNNKHNFENIVIQVEKAITFLEKQR